MEFSNTGKVIEMKDGVVVASGLSQVGYGEIVEIQTDSGKVKGIALNLEEDKVGIVVFGDYQKVEAGQTVISTNQELNIEVSEDILGHIINPVGIDLETNENIKHKQGTKMPLEKVAPGIIERKNITNEKPMNTGILSIDSMIPIGRGQRELIIGDRQSGKTAICIDTIINQKGGDVVCIYVAIGQKLSKIARIKKKLEEEGAMKYTVIVCASASDPVSFQYIAPYAGCAIGEYFAEKGKHALVIYDDLTKHAWAYREISLLLKRPPGREAYPGDIFYLHSRLLERAVQFSDKNGSGSLTALPIVETQAGDVSAYIPTNIISITDGQIFLDTDLFNSGQKPAINIGISVSRVGGSAQTKAMKKVAGKMKLDLAQYRELQMFAQFGSELDEETKKKLIRGDRISELLKQNQYSPLTIPKQVCLIYVAVNGYLDVINKLKTQEWKKDFLNFLDVECEKILSTIEETNDFSEDIEIEYKTQLNKFNFEKYA